MEPKIVTYFAELEDRILITTSSRFSTERTRANSLVSNFKSLFSVELQGSVTLPPEFNQGICEVLDKNGSLLSRWTFLIKDQMVIFKGGILVDLYNFGVIL